MSIASEITRLQNAKSALATSIGNKGVTVPTSTKLDGYSALVDQIQTGGGGGEGWQRPSEWPDYSKIPLSGVGANEVYLTYDCRSAKKGLVANVISIRCVASGGYTVERGSIGNSGFVAVTTNSVASNTDFHEELPTDECDYVVYRVSSSNNMTSFEMRDWTNYIGNKSVNIAMQPVLEMYGKLEYATSVPGHGNTKNFAVVLKSITSLSQSFYQNNFLENVDTTGWDTSAVTSLYRTFMTCPRLQYIDVSKWDTSSVTNMQDTFNGCSVLHELDVSDWDTSKVTTFYQTFYGCILLEELDVSKWDTSSAQNMQSMFGSCNSLVNIDVSSFDVSEVTNLKSMFNNCNNIEPINISDWDMAKVTTVETFMQACYRTRSVRVNNTLTVLNHMAFSSLNFCTEYIFEATTPPTMANNNIFSGINSATKIYVPDESVNAYKTASNWSTYASYIYPISDLT